MGCWQKSWLHIQPLGLCTPKKLGPSDLDNLQRREKRFYRQLCTECLRATSILAMHLTHSAPVLRLKACMRQSLKVISSLGCKSTRCSQRRISFACFRTYRWIRSLCDGRAVLTRVDISYHGCIWHWSLGLKSLSVRQAQLNRAASSRFLHANFCTHLAAYKIGDLGPVLRFTPCDTSEDDEWRLKC